MPSVQIEPRETAGESFYSRKSSVFGINSCLFYNETYFAFVVGMLQKQEVLHQQNSELWGAQEAVIPSLSAAAGRRGPSS